MEKNKIKKKKKISRNHYPGVTLWRFLIHQGQNF